jgi:hypothetical protein
MKRIRLLILTGFKTLEGFQMPMENRTLLWGLDQANIEWHLHNPWKKLPNLSRFDAALVTVYWRHNVNFTYHCKKFEKACREMGFPVINTIHNAEGRHSYYLKVWREQGIPCARYQRFRSFDDLTMDTYPLILRRDGVHRGGGMYLVRNPEEAREVILKQHAEAAAADPEPRAPQPINLALEFVETKTVDNYYCKWRAYVVGDEVIPAHFMRSRSPFVNYKDAALWAGTCAADETFRHQGEPRPDLLLAAARATGCDILTLDYSVKPDGTYVFWEGNRERATAGDIRVRWLGLRDVDLEYGAAVARLVHRRVNAAAAGEPEATLAGEEYR